MSAADTINAYLAMNRGERTRTMAGVTDTAGNPIGRDEYASLLEGERLVLGGPSISIKAAEAYMAAALLDELAAIYTGEQLGRLARELAVKLYDRLGI